MAHLRTAFQPGPIDRSVLTLQAGHRSEGVWDGDDMPTLYCRHAIGEVFRVIQDDPRIRYYLAQSGFVSVYRVGQIYLDHHLITALVERWRQETHTFHLPIGECTVTLQDVQIILGLPIDGQPIIAADVGRSTRDWIDLCRDLLGLTPEESDIQGGCLRMRWLLSHFRELPRDASVHVVQQHTRAVILLLIGGSLLADKSSSRVRLIYLSFLRDLEETRHMSWGSAVLACLYRELCRASRRTSREIAGPLVLLQVWAWERFSHIRPERPAPRQPVPYDQRHGDGPLACRWRVSLSMRVSPAHALVYYRDQLDRTTEDHMSWMPYTDEVIASLPDFCVSHSAIWRARVPLICMDIIEWHLPDRVMRQFGFRQYIPVHCDTRADLHSLDRRGRRGFDWTHHHFIFIQAWDMRHESIVDGIQSDERMRDDDLYMMWYHQITRRWVAPVEHVPVVGYQPSAAVTLDLVLCSLSKFISHYLYFTTH